MANGEPMSGQKWMATIIGTGVLGVIAAGMMAVANDARIAINVAEQHGEELLLIRGELAAVRVEMMDRTAMRYTSRDALAHEKYVERRFNEIEKKLDRLENK
jgi:hypothetical protein